MQRRTLLMLALLFALMLSACNFGGQAQADPPITAPTVTSAPTVATAAPTSEARAATAAATQIATTAPATKAPTTLPTTQAQSAIPATSAPVVTSAPATAANSPNTTSSGAPRVLAWNKDAKMVAWYATSGQPQKVAEGAATRVLPCGITPSGDQMLLYRGDTVAQPNLIPLSGSDQPKPIGDGSALACELSGRTAFSPDGTRLAYIKYASDATINVDFTMGTLRLLKMPDLTEIMAIDKVTAFNLQNDGAAILKFLTNSKGQSDRADLTWWDTSSNKERPLELNFSSLDNCVFTSGRVLRVGDKVYTSLGERCTKPTGSVYRILRTDFAGGNSTNFVDKTASGGKYYPNTNTNDLFALPDGKGLIALYPNGLSTEVANLIWINLADGKVTPILSAVVTDQSPTPMPRRFLRNPQGTQLAMITRNGNGGETLYVYDLSKPESDPAQVTDANRSNRINALAWNKAGDRLVYVVAGDDPSLSYFDLKGEKKLVTRGVFQGLMINAEGTSAATSEQVLADKNDLRNNLVLLSLSDGTRTKLVEGQKGDSALVPLIMR